MRRHSLAKTAGKQAERRARLINSQIKRETGYGVPDNLVLSDRNYGENWDQKRKAHNLASYGGSNIERKNSLIEGGYLRKGHKVQINLEGFGVKNLARRSKSMNDVIRGRKWKTQQAGPVNVKKEIDYLNPEFTRSFNSKYMKQNKAYLGWAKSQYILLRNNLRASGKREDLQKLVNLEDRLSGFVYNHNRWDQALHYSKTGLIEKLREKPFEERMKWGGASDQDIKQMKSISLDHSLSLEQKLDALEKVNKKLVERLKEELIDEYLESD